LNVLYEVKWKKYVWQSLPKNAARIIATLFLHRTSLLRMAKNLLGDDACSKKQLPYPHRYDGVVFILWGSSRLL